MSVTITAVPAVPSGIDSAPAPSATSERPLMDFVASLQNSPGSGMPHLANPAALASELFGSLRGYFERAQTLERAPRSAQQNRSTDSDGVRVTLTSVAGGPQTDLHGGPARENIEPLDANGGASAAVGISLAQLQRAMDLALVSMNFATETALVVRGTSQLSHSANTLLRGQ
jgi:hypothetical protein